MHEYSHKKVVLQAIEILKADGHLSFAHALDSFRPDLFRGVAHADRAGVGLYLDVDLSCIWAWGKRWNVYRRYICNMASLSHYYDPATDAGLDLGGYGGLEGWIEGGSAAIGVALGAAGCWANVSTQPALSFAEPYQSAVDECEEHFTKAVEIWRGLAPAESGFAWADAMFHLGWASHFIADVCTSPHTVSNKFWTHGDYEDVIESVQKYEEFQLPAIGAVGAYNTGHSAREIAVAAATQTRQELYLYDEGRWPEGAHLAISRAAGTTARLLAKFLLTVGVENEARPLSLFARDAHGALIPEAVLFYRMEGEPRWRAVQMDAGGSQLMFPSNSRVELRPAAPGYLFRGGYYGNAPNIPEFPEPSSPVIYEHSPDPLHAPSINFSLEEAVPAVRPAVRAAILESPPSLSPARSTMLRLPELLGGDEASSAVAERVRIHLIGAQEQSEPYLEVDSDLPAHLRVSIMEPLNLFTADHLRTRREVAQVLPLESARTQEEVLALLQQPRQEPPHREEPELRPRSERRLSQEANEVLEGVVLTRFRTSVGRQAVQRGYVGPEVDWRDSILGRLPVLLIPGIGEYRVHAEILQDPGDVGYACGESIRQELRSAQSVLFRIRPGNQPGKLRLKVLVYDRDDELIDAQVGELWVAPPNEGGDEFPFTPPSLTAVH